MRSDRAERALRREQSKDAQETQKRKKERGRPQVGQKDFPVEHRLGQPRLVNTTFESPNCHSSS